MPTTTINPSDQTITQYTVQVGGASNLLASVGPGSVGQVLQSAGNAANPAYSTATFPSTATGTGKILRADGTNWVATTATFPDTAGTSGNVLTSNGTNWSSTAPATAGTVTSVSGTTNRITSTGGNTPVIDISGSYVGQSSITTLGAITAGSYALATATIIGQTSNTAPSAGNIGEQIRSAVAKTTLTVSNNSSANVTSISLTAGIWDVSAIGVYAAAAITGTFFSFSIATVSGATGSTGDSLVDIPLPPTASSDLCLSIPSYRISLSTTTIIYLTSLALFSVGTLTAGGRISGTRVA